MLSPQNCCFPSLAKATSERVIDQPAIQNRFANVHDRMMQHALVEAWRCDHPLFGIPDQKLLKSTDRDCPLTNRLRHFSNTVIETGCKLPHHSLSPSPTGSFVERHPQIFRLVNPIKQIRCSPDN